MNKKNDNIYIYLWEEFNTVYVGRTVNPKSRHWAHNHRKSERTYQFSVEHGVEHPKMIIIENDLTIEEGVEREKYWINYYRDIESCNVLNKTCGGQMGRKTVYTKEQLKEYKKEYYEKNKKWLLSLQKEHYDIHKKEISLKMREHYKSHKEELRMKKKLYREAHKDELRKYNREYQRKYRLDEKVLKKILKAEKKINKKICNYEKKIIRENERIRRKKKIIQYQKEYREKNKEKMKEYQKNYQEKNKEILKLKRKYYYETHKKKS